MPADTPQITAPTGRLTSLDAVRGLAACGVLLSHCYLTIPEKRRAAIDSSFWSAPLHPFHDGTGAVIIFFVLSGYVLSLPYWRGIQQTYLHFIIRRICRIYLPFAASLVFAALLYLLPVTPAALDTSHWFNNWGPSDFPAPSDLAGHFLMVGTYPTIRLNNVMWSLVSEMRISAIFPLLVVLSRAPRLAGITAFLIMAIATKLIVLSAGQITHPTVAPNVWISLLWTLQFTPFFIAGILLNKYRQPIATLWKEASTPLRLCFYATPAIIFCMRHQLTDPLGDALDGLAAAIIIVLALEAPQLRSFLNRPIPQWLGRISYSIYLVHLPILLVIGRVVLAHAPFLVFVGTIVAASLGAATLMHRFVELPAINLGRRITGQARLAPSLSSVPPITD
jgi:peptidoglycan/LPS O-acetylase OafA/YrhL